MGMKATPTSPEQTTQYIRRESDKWGRVIRQARIR
jgi:tripartite-type tricarboxylate transporter receptor subunit TctC